MIHDDMNLTPEQQKWVPGWGEISVRVLRMSILDPRFAEALKLFGEANEAHVNDDFERFRTVVQKVRHLTQTVTQ